MPAPSGKWIPTSDTMAYDPVTGVKGVKDAQGNYTPWIDPTNGDYALFNPSAYGGKGGVVLVKPDGTLESYSDASIDPRSAKDKQDAEVAGADTDISTHAAEENALKQRNTATERAAAEAAAADADRQRQIQFSDTLNDTITNPNAPSVAREQLAQATQANEATQLSQASGATGENAFLARQGAARNIAAANQTEAQQAAEIRAREVATAQGQLGNVLGQVSQEDINRYNTDTATGGASNQEILDANAKASGLAEQHDEATHNLWVQIGGKAATGLGSFLGSSSSSGSSDPGGDSTVSSDRNVKKDIHADPDEKVMAFLSAIQPDSFRYKGENPQAPEHHGVMAQDLEQSEIGRSLVHQSPRGKVVDVGTAAMAALAAAASLHRRLARVEGKKGGGRG